MTQQEQKNAAKEFAEYWKDKGYEKGESQPFWLSLLRDVFGVEHPEEIVKFEGKVMIDHTSFIDGYVALTHTLIEQKSIDKDLRKPIRQSDGSLLTPFEQAKRYSVELSYDDRPRWIITCNFKEFLIYDMNKPSGEPESILLKDLPKEYYRLQFIVDPQNENIKRETSLSIAAGDLIGEFYDAMLKQYKNPEDPETLRSLNVLCVRLVFCLYAEDAGLFGSHTAFHDYIKQYNVKGVRSALIELFKVLNQKLEERDPDVEEEFRDFPYVNGGLFADDDIKIPQFTEELVELMLAKASENFNWSEISPTIFGAVFESTLNPETRRSGGMHYTSIENIHKVIDPLFLNDLNEEFAQISDIKVEKTRNARLDAFTDKLAKLTFLDPACGSGNFLTETYLSLRKLENKAIELRHKGQMQMLNAGNVIKVSINQFYGIEINDFAVTVAKTALWIAESQMMLETSEIVHMQIDFLPLRSYANIVEGNALRIDWETVVPKDKLNYIMGNPPFVGARQKNSEQAIDVQTIFAGWKNNGNLDYVACWYKKSSDYITGTNIRVAFVSTNSITQGEQVAILWKPLFEGGLHFDFAYRTFRWDSEADIKAHVHCVIIGFSKSPVHVKKIIFEEDIQQVANNINGYLLDGQNIFIESRTQPLCAVPHIGIGNKPIDGGFYLFTKEEKEEFIRKEPASKKWFRPWIGADEFINRTCRYCLWLGNCSLSELRKMPECLKRVKAVREFRLSSKSAGTVKLAERPTRFHVENIPKTNYMIIPEVSSERRRYIPMGYLTPDVLCSNLVKIISGATLYHFGVLTSNVHMAWMRVVCGRLETRYRYSKDIVYNNFPWCTPTAEQKEKIEKTAQAILDARNLYPDCSLADLYDEVTMPNELRIAHQANDRAVMQAYGFSPKMTEPEIVAELMKRYQALLNNETK